MEVLILIFGGLVLAVAGATIISKFIIQQKAEAILAKTAQDEEHSFTKKYAAADPFAYRGTFLKVGMALAITTAIVAFSWTWYITETKLPVFQGLSEEITFVVPPTRPEQPKEQATPPPSKTEIKITQKEPDPDQKPVEKTPDPIKIDPNTLTIAPPPRYRYR